MRKYTLTLAAAVLATSGLAMSAHAQVTEVTWGGSTGPRNWQDNANWIGGVFPNDPTPEDSLTKANLAVTLGANLTVDLGATDITIARMAIGSTSNPVASSIVSTSSLGASRLVFRNDDEEVLSELEDADFNNDTVVDGRDFLIWQRGFGVSADNINDRGDANLDDIVDGLDLVIWQDQYGLGSGIFNIGTPALESTGVAGVTNTIDSTIHIKNQQLEIGGSRNLVINGDITYEGDPLAAPAGASSAGFRVLTSTMTVTMNGDIVVANSDGLDGVDFQINNNVEASGTLVLNGKITGNGDMIVGRDVSGGGASGLGTVILNGPSTYAGSFRAGRGNLVLNHNDALGKSDVLNNNGTPEDPNDDFFPMATYRQTGPSNLTGYNMISTDDSRTISNDIVFAQWQTITGEHSITFDGHVTQTNNRGIINVLPAGKTVTISGDLDIFNTVEPNIERRFEVDGTGKTIISGTINDNELTPSTGYDYGLRKNGSGALVIDVDAGDNNHSGREVVLLGNMHYADNDSLNVSTDPKAKILSVAGAVGVDVHPAGQNLATNTVFIGKIDPASTGGLMLSPSDAAIAINFGTASLNNVENMSLAAPEAGITFTGTVAPNNNEYRLGGGSGRLTLQGNQLTGARTLSVRNGGIVQLTGVNTYSGVTTIEGKYSGTRQTEAVDGDTGEYISPTLEVDDLNDGGVSTAGNPSSIGTSTNAAANLVIQGGTLRYIGTGDSTSRLFTIGTHGATLDSSGTGALVFSNTGAAATPDAADITGTLDDFGGSPNVVYNVSNSRDVVIGMTISDPDPADPNNDFTQAPCAVDGSNCIPALDAQTPPEPVVTTGVSDNGKEIGLSAIYPFIIKNNTRLVLGAVDRTLKLTGTNTQANILTPVISDSVKGSNVGITKEGTGTWYLESVNTNTGPTLVTAGTLGGNGGVGGDLTVSTTATFAPGASGATAIGDFSVAGSFTLDAGAVLGVQLGGTAASAYDKLNVTGTATLSGAINLSTISFNPAITNAFTVLTAAGGIVDNGLTITGLTGFTKSIVGNSLILTKTAALTALSAAVPEPSSLVLIGLAMACCGLRRK